MTAGYLGMGFGRFFLFNLIGSFTWALSIGGLGYLFGQSLEVLTKGVRLAEIGFLLIVVGLPAVYLLNSRRKRKARKESV